MTPQPAKPPIWKRKSFRDYGLWLQLMRETQAFVAARGITEGDIADEVAAVRAAIAAQARK